MPLFMFNVWSYTQTHYSVEF